VLMMYSSNSSSFSWSSSREIFSSSESIPISYRVAGTKLATHR
jgi:hypothetical protein